MLFLLRKIRRKLINNDNKVITYLLYAVGEITLVVIGILIAVSIDDWNEGRKLNISQIEILESLHSDISHNIKSLESVIHHDSTAHSKSAYILNLIQDPNAQNDDTLQSYFGAIGRFDIFQPKKMAYEVVKSKGLEIIKDKELRSDIIKIYDEVYAMNPWILEIRKETHIMTVEILNKRFWTEGRANRRIPNDFEALKSDSEFINHVSYVTGESLNIVSHYHTLLEVTKLVQGNIEQELRKLNND